MASFKKRLMAYLLDMIIIVLISTFIGLIIPVSDNLVNLSKEATNIQTSYLNNEISFTKYFNQMADIMKDIDKEQVLTYVVSVLLTLSYFVIYPFYNKGQTLGKKRFKIRVVNDLEEDPSINELLIRNIIINNLGILLIQLLIIFILPATSYYITLTCLSFLQVIVIIISVFTIIRRKDKKGLHDLVAKTKVIEVK